MDTAFHLSQGVSIGPDAFAESLEEISRMGQLAKMPLVPGAAEMFPRLINGQGTFWELVHDPYLDRELNRQEVRELVTRGLVHSGGSYKRLLAHFGIRPQDYLRFMDFLRHHRLKPTREH